MRYFVLLLHPTNKNRAAIAIRNRLISLISYIDANILKKYYLCSKDVYIMKRVVVILVALFAFLTSSAQIEHSIILEQSSFRKVNTDALTGVNIDPIRQDISRNPCARLKIRFANMSRAEVDELVVKVQSNTDIVRCDVAQYYDNVLILEMTALPYTRFFITSPSFGESNQVTLNLEANREYEMEARLNQSFSIAISSNVEGAEVYLDGIIKGHTGANHGLTIKRVMIGSHTLKLVYGDKSAQQQIEVNSDNIFFRQELNVKIERYDITFRTTPADAIIVVDGMEQSVTDGVLSLRLTKGNHSYNVSAEQYHPQSGSIVVNGPTERRIELAPRYGCLSVENVELNGAEVFVDGKSVGIAPLKVCDVIIGSHTIKLSKAGYSDNIQTVTITEDKPVTINATLAKRAISIYDPECTYNIGDLVIVNGVQGVIFQTSPMVKVVSVDEGYTVYAPWTKSNVEIGIDSHDYCRDNMAVAMTVPNWHTDLPAFKWCADLGEGWYLPARSELVEIYKQKDKINQTLTLNNMATLGSKCSSKWMWSSTESDRKAYYMDFERGLPSDNKYGFYATDKQFNSSVRAIFVLSPKSSAPYKVGDYYNDGQKEGVVFDVSADGMHGKIVSMAESESRIAWAEGQVNYEKFLGATSRSDGKYNMSKVKALANWQTNYPAFRWCAVRGEWWYIPAIDEIKRLLADEQVFNAVNATLLAKGGMKLRKSHNMSGVMKEHYWSSTESDKKSQSFIVYMPSGNVIPTFKSSENFVRAVAIF